MDRRYGGRVSEGVRSMARDRVTWRPGPIASAVFLALVSTPFAALSIRAASTGTVNSPREPVDYLDAAGMAIVAILVAGLVVADNVAGPVAIAMLPCAAAAPATRYEAVWLCIDSCFPSVRDSDLSSGIG